MLFFNPIFKISQTRYWFFKNKQIKTPLIKQYPIINYYENGATCLGKIYSDISKKRNKRLTILIPAYFCGQSLRYLRSFKPNILFYPLTDNLYPDYEIIKEKYSDQDIDIFVHVHYFGNVECQKESKNFANSIGATLVEDSAHVMSPLNHDWVGDYIFFSPHKHFPLPKIGILISKDASDNNNFLNRNYAIPYAWMAKEIIKNFIKYKKKSNWGIKWSSASDVIELTNQSMRSITTTTKYINEYKSYGRIKKRNYDLLKDLLKESDGWQSFMQFKNNSIPYLFPMICIDEYTAERRYKILNQESQIVMQWPDLPIEIRNYNTIESIQSQRWLKRTLFFSINPQLSKKLWIKKIQKSIRSKDF